MCRILSFFLLLIGFGCSSGPELHETVIIGGGLMGSSTAWQLANAGKKVLLLEKQGETYDSGSSFGEARIARSLGPQKDKWSYLHNRTVIEAQKLVDFLNDTEKGQHSMEDIYRTTPVSYVRHIAQMERISRTLEGQKDSFQFAPDAVSARTLFDANLPDSAIFLREYKPFSGIINPKALIKKLHLATQLKESEIRYHTKVISLKKKKDRFELVTENTLTGRRETIHSRRIAAAAGPYNGELLRNIAPYFHQLISPERVFLGFYRLRPEFFKAMSTSAREKLLRSYPVINSTAGTREGANFSMIEKFDTHGNPLIKIGGHFQRSLIDDLDGIWKKELSPEEIAWGKKHILRYLSIIDLSVGPDDLVFESGYSCVYSLSSTEVPYVTPIKNGEGPDHNCIVLGAMSGVGAKGALTYGLLAANWLLDRHEQNENYGMIKRAMGYERLLNDLDALKK